MTETFDFNELTGHPYEDRQKNVLYATNDFKIRIIDLPENGSLPQCEMQTHVVFVVMQGEVDITVNGVVHHLIEKQSLVSGPAVFWMKSVKGAKLMGIQIKKSEK